MNSAIDAYRDVTISVTVDVIYKDGQLVGFGQPEVEHDRYMDVGWSESLASQVVLADPDRLRAFSDVADLLRSANQRKGETNET